MKKNIYMMVFILYLDMINAWKVLEKDGNTKCLVIHLIELYKYYFKYISLLF